MNYLYLKFSAISITGPFKRNKLLTTSLTFMKDLESVEELIDISLDKFNEFLFSHEKNQFDDPEAVDFSLKKTITDILGIIP
ncbi:MAG TPA: hypothetical protein VK072_01570 [Candidatus Avamphibacillus sp.]|nr:hypothetical protein [Candidatus Avamphibacillus sp.]